MIAEQSLTKKASVSDSPYCIFLAASINHNWDYAAKGTRITIESCRISHPNIPIAVLIEYMVQMKRSDRFFLSTKSDRLNYILADAKKAV